jgi:hypothetical protein
MATLKINDLVCIDQNEKTQDEPYIIVGGHEVWDGDMDEGDSFGFNIDCHQTSYDQVLCEIPENYGGDISKEFYNATYITLMEDDGNHWWDRNDNLGTFAISSCEAGTGEHWLNFTDGNAHYSMSYEVFA